MSDEPSALALAGLDPTGGAGLVADCVVLARHGVRVAGIVTAWTDQDVRGVRGVTPVGTDVVARALRDACSGGAPSAAKTGLLADAATIEAIARELPASTALVVDPVLASSDGFPFLDDRGVEALLSTLVPRAALVTPNLPECLRLAGIRAGGPDAARRAALSILERGARAVLVTGGHAEGPEAVDILFDAAGERAVRAPRVAGPSPHGTGCALSAAIAGRLARGEPLDRAVAGAKRLVHAMIRDAYPVRGGRPRLAFAAGDPAE
jgi:hydroxymethylpyrimidine/phosphomethylpyrimidine kinase